MKGLGGLVWISVVVVINWWRCSSDEYRHSRSPSYSPTPAISSAEATKQDQAKSEVALIASQIERQFQRGGNPNDLAGSKEKAVALLTAPRKERGPLFQLDDRGRLIDEVGNSFEVKIEERDLVFSVRDKAEKPVWDYRTTLEMPKPTPPDK